MKVQNNILWLLATCPLNLLIAVLTLAYLASVVIFALTYWYFGFIPNRNFFDCAYFSFLTQANFGYEFIPADVPIFKIVASIQIAIGIIWFAFIPSIVLVRITVPTPSAFVISNIIVFYPKKRCFVFRYANFSRINATDLEFDFRARLPTEDDYYNIRNLSIALNNPAPPDATFNVPFLMRTKLLDDYEPQKIQVEQDYQIALHPGHLHGNIELKLRTSCTYIFGQDCP